MRLMRLSLNNCFETNYNRPIDSRIPFCAWGTTKKLITKRSSSLICTPKVRHFWGAYFCRTKTTCYARGFRPTMKQAHNPGDYVPEVS